MGDGGGARGSAGVSVVPWEVVDGFDDEVVPSASRRVISSKTRVRLFRQESRASTYRMKRTKRNQNARVRE